MYLYCTVLYMIENESCKNFLEKELSSTKGKQAMKK